MSESVAPAKVIVSDTTVPTMDGIKCHMPSPSPCTDCDATDIGANCALNCAAHCLSASATISNTLTLFSAPTISSEITSTFKHFYLYISTPELRPPLV